MQEGKGAVGVGSAAVGGHGGALEFFGGDEHAVAVGGGGDVRGGGMAVVGVVEVALPGGCVGVVMGSVGVEGEGVVV